MLCRRPINQHFLVRFGVSLILQSWDPWLHGNGRNIANIIVLLQEDRNVRSFWATFKPWFKLEALEDCNVSHTQQVCNWDDQNMVEVFYSVQNVTDIALMQRYHFQWVGKMPLRYFVWRRLNISRRTITHVAIGLLHHNAIIITDIEAHLQFTEAK